jgi:hypothetical protein
VIRMIDFCKRHHKVENDFDLIVTDMSLNEHLGYKIPGNKVPLTKTGKPKTMKTKVSTTSVPPVARRETLRTRKPPSQAAREEGLRAAPGTTPASREESILGCSQSLGHDTDTDSRAVVEPKVPLFREARGVVIEMGIPDSPRADATHSVGGSGVDFREEVPAAEVQRDVILPIIPEQRNTLDHTPHPETTRSRKGIGSKRKAGDHQEGRAPKRSAVEEGDDFLLNEISLAAQNFSRPEFTWRDEPLSPPSAADETRERSGFSTDLSPDSGAGTFREGTAETPRADSSDIKPRSFALGSEEGSPGEEPDQHPPWTRIPTFRVPQELGLPMLLVRLTSWAPWLLSFLPGSSKISEGLHLSNLPKISLNPRLRYIF